MKLTRFSTLAGRFTEDGSFIGQYGGATGKRKPPVPEDKSPSAVATFV